jgi:alkylmercury lyase-like protein
MEFETAVKLHVYDTLARTAHAPTTFEAAAALGATVERVAGAYQSLHRKRLLVPEPGDPSRIRMAPPFSGVPTAFRVWVGERAYYANCVWDALGIPAALHRDAVVEAQDGSSGEPMRLVVEDAGPDPEPCVIHFAVPAARWWEDIVHT